MSLQTDKFNVLIHLYGNAGVEAFTSPPPLSLSLFFYHIIHFWGGLDWLCGELSEGAWEEERRDKASSLRLRGEHNMDLRFVLNSDNRDKRGQGRRRSLKVQPTAQNQQRLRSSAVHCFVLFSGVAFLSHSSKLLLFIEGLAPTWP